MPYKNRERRLEYHKKYNKKHYQDNKQMYKDKAKRWKKDNPDRERVLRKRGYDKRTKKRREENLCIQCGLPFDEDDLLLNGRSLRCSVCRTKHKAYMDRIRGHNIPLPISYGGNNRLHDMS